MIKLVMSDLDETILDHGKEISKENIEMIEKLIENDVLFVPTTGRYFGGIPEYFHNHPDIKYLVSSNGALITDKTNNKVLMQSSLDTQVVYEILEMAFEKATNIIVVIEGGLVVDNRIFDNPHQEHNEFLKRIVASALIPDNLLDYVKNTDKVIKKVDFGFDDMDFRKDFYEKLKSYPGVNAVSSHGSNVEITNDDASKGSALEFMQKLLNLDKSEILAISDNDNDISMLQKAGVGIAMGNASDEVKSHSDAVTLDVEDHGFAYAIKKHLKL